MTRAVGVDLGGTNVRAALVDVGEGRILDERKAPVTNRDPDAVAALVEELVRGVDREAARIGVGVGFAGMLRGWSGVVVNAPNFGWREIDLRTLLRARVGERTELYNDLNAIAFGEARWGGARGVGDVLCVYVGTGLGAGIVAANHLYIGATHLAGEMGHVKVVPGGRLCGCGQRGCIEAYASGVNLRARAREELAAGQTSLAVELAGGLEHVHAGHLDEAARRGDPYANRLWDEVSLLLGVALANAVTMLNPSRLVMGGGVWQGAPELRRRSIVVFETEVNAASREGFAIVDTVLGDAAGVLGAAALISEGRS
jgi:glucokinase